MIAMPTSLAEYARSLQESWQRSDGDPAARSRYLQTVGRLYYENHSWEATAIPLQIEPVEVRRIAYGLSHADARLIEPQDQVCTFCGQRRADVARLIAGPGVFICGTCSSTAAAVVDGDADAASGGWQRVSPDGQPKCNFCGRTKGSDVAVKGDACARICGLCVDECWNSAN